ncbi:MAG: hypothetical protein HYZ49_00235 [Chloroflexi bacterium]|nr:hypothetical protein [Chloroflexota bacterium]
MPDLLAFFLWWLIVTIFGFVAWPILFWFFRFLPDRGYSLSKTGGLLAVGYVGWLLGNFGFVLVNPGGVVAALLIVGVLSAFALRSGNSAEMGKWLRQNWQVVLITEIIFLAAFAFWAYARALNPTITATEKPMEFAFLNSVLRTGTQPPGDPWLSGYAISYYYFGYIIMAMLISLSGVLPSAGFNLGIALLFALTALGAFGVVLNLIAGVRSQDSGVRVGRAIMPALLGPLFMLIGNLNGFLEVMHKMGLFGESFWAWLDIKWTNVAPTLPSAGWMPDRFLWWWQASRVVHDINPFTGAEIEVIDEFPFFSFLLGDMHPHVLGLPFVFLAIAFALNLFLMVQTNADKPRATAETNEPNQQMTSLAWPESLVVTGISRAFSFLKSDDWQQWLPPLAWPDLLIGAILLGGLSFLNTWDFPIYIFVVVASYTVARGLRDSWATDVWRDGISLGAGLAVCGVLLYLPFYIGFRSQLGGILPNVIFATRLQQFAVMFGPSLFVVLALMGWLVARRWRTMEWRGGAMIAFSILASLMIVCALLAFFIITSDRPDAQQAIDSMIGTANLQDVLPQVLRLRLERAAMPLLLTLLLAVAAAWVFAPRQKTDDEPSRPNLDLTPFAVILIATGALLTLGPEFVYLRDFFGWRMNTVFKFYYQAWVIWSIAAAFGTYLLLQALKPVGKTLFGAGVAAVLALGLIYPVLSTTTITENWMGTTRDLEGNPYATLDGMAYMATSRTSDYEAIKFLNATVAGRPVIAEAVGGSYTEYARVAAHTGLPTVIGWPFHELQWRGNTEASGGREDKIKLLYQAPTWTEAQVILDEFNIRYVYVGPMEAAQYGADGLGKFARFMRVIYQADGVTIYERKDK